MKNLTLKNITKVCNGIYHGPQEKLQEEVTAITTDSRKVEKGGLFVPVVGERVDAHPLYPPGDGSRRTCNFIRESS